MKLYFEKFYIAEKSKDVEIVLSIPKAKSGSISIKIRQPSLWTDPYLPDLVNMYLFLTSMLTVILLYLDAARSDGAKRSLR